MDTHARLVNATEDLRHPESGTFRLGVANKPPGLGDSGKSVYPRCGESWFDLDTVVTPLPMVPYRAPW